MKTISIKVTTGLCALALLFSSICSHAALLAYEGFNYADGDLSGVSGGGSFGFGTNAWSAGTTGDTVVTGSFNYTDTSGNVLSNSGSRAFLTGAGGSSTPVRTLDFARGTDGSVTWISFVGKRNGADTIRVANLQIRTNTTERLAFGKATTNVTTATWSVYSTGSAANSIFSTNALDVSSFVVVRINHLAGNDDAWMWVNPLLSTEPSTNVAAVTYTNRADYGFNGFRGFAGNAASGGAFCEFEMDEIRVGETYADVAPFTTGSPVVNSRWTNVVVSGSSISLTLTGAASTVYTVFGNSDASTAVTNWTNLGTLTTGAAGNGTFTDTNAVTSQQRRFYRAKQ